MQPGRIASRESEASDHIGMQTGVSIKIITVTEIQRETAYGHFKAKRWTEFLMSLPVGSTSGWAFANYREMESCKTVGWRLNVRNDATRRLRIISSYTQNILTIEVSEKKSDEG